MKNTVIASELIKIAGELIQSEIKKDFFDVVDKIAVGYVRFSDLAPTVHRKGNKYEFTVNETGDRPINFIIKEMRKKYPKFKFERYFVTETIFTMPVK